MEIGIIGAGMAGLSCAAHLQTGGFGVTLFDKGRGAGGRMSTRRIATPLGEAQFDHGAQYFTVRDPAFKATVDGWAQAGHAERWPIVGQSVWVGTPSMNSLVKAMAVDRNIVWNRHVGGIERTGTGWHLTLKDGLSERFDAIVLAIPAEQAASLLGLQEFDFARRAMFARSQPCWTVMAAFAQPLDIASPIIRDRAIIGWAARNSAKPGRTGPESWVIQGKADWSKDHLEGDPDTVIAALLAELEREAGAPLPPLIASAAHRWRYAMSAGTGDGSLWNETIRLGVCGDWLLGPRVENAWLSGRQLADQMCKALNLAEA